MDRSLTAALDPEKVYEFRCLDCGRVCWTTLQLGCKRCRSKSLEDFEPYGPAITGISRHLLQEFSSCLAEGNSQGAFYAAKKLSISFDKRHEPVTPVHYGSLVKGLEVVADDFAQGKVAGPDAMMRVSSLWEDASQIVYAEKEKLAECALDLTISALGHVDEASPKVQRSFWRVPFLDEFGRPSKAVFPSRDLIEKRVIAGIPLADREEAKRYFHGPPSEHRPWKLKTRTTTFDSAHTQHYDRASDRKVFHVNLSAASWDFISNLGRLLPIAYVLLTLHLPTVVELGAAAEAVRAILMNITRLRPGEAEQCVLSGIVCAKENLGRDPTTVEILAELHRRACLGKPCKFAGSGYACSATADDIEPVLKFLVDKKVVKKTSAVAWAVAEMNLF